MSTDLFGTQVSTSPAVSESDLLAMLDADPHVIDTPQGPVDLRTPLGARYSCPRGRWCRSDGPSTRP